MSCKTLLDDPNSIVTQVDADTVYIGSIANPFISNLYSFEMVESEVMTFNFNITAFTGSLELILELYKLNEYTGEYDPNGTSYINQVVNSIDYDITPGNYAFCLTSTQTPMEYELLLEFTEFPFIVFPSATASHGSEVNTEFIDFGINICDSPIIFSIAKGSLPNGFTMSDNGVIQGLLPELDCVVNSNTLGIFANIVEFEMDFSHGYSSIIYNYLPGDYVASLGSALELELKIDRNNGFNYLSYHGATAETDLTTYRQQEFFHGQVMDLDFTVYPKVFTDGDNYNITDEIPPSFSLFNNNQGNENYYPTQVEWEFVVRAAFLEDPSQYKERTFKICISNNWDTDRDIFAKAFETFETDVLIEADLLNLEEIDEVAIRFEDLTTDEEEIPTQPIEFDSIIKLATSVEFVEEVEEIELCMPCIVEELPRIREIDTSGLCVCDIDIDIKAKFIEPEQELVAGIPEYCGNDFANDMMTEMACIPLEPCGIPTIYIRSARLVDEPIVLEPQCDDTCN